MLVANKKPRDSPSVELPLPPGRLYKFWRSLPILTALLALAVVVGSMDLVSKLQVLGGVGAIWLASVGYLMYLSSPRELVVDEGGVRLVRSGKARIVIPWGNMMGIQYGKMPYMRGVRSGLNPYVAVYGKSGRPIRIVEAYYDIPQGTLVSVSKTIADAARARGIRVVEKDTVTF